MVQIQNMAGFDWPEATLDDDEDINDAVQIEEDDAFYDLMARRGAVMQTAEVAEYAADLARELAALCRNARLDLVAFMLEAAAEEAAQQRAAEALVRQAGLSGIDQA
jgi:uncharacterized protein (DUF885 family)